MGKPLGFFSLDESNSDFLTDMTEEWGCDLSQMSEADRLFLIFKIAVEAWEQAPEGNSYLASYLGDRVDELSYHEKLNLLQALTQ